MKPSTGPNYNNAGSAYYGSIATHRSNRDYPSLWEGQRHAREALRLMEGCSDVQRALIRAMQSRYEDWKPSGCDHLERRFAASMRAAWEQCAPDPNVGAADCNPTRTESRRSGGSGADEPS